MGIPEHAVRSRALYEGRIDLDRPCGPAVGAAPRVESLHDAGLPFRPPSVAQGRDGRIWVADGGGLRRLAFDVKGEPQPQPLACAFDPVADRKLGPVRVVAGSDGSIRARSNSAVS